MTPPKAYRGSLLTFIVILAAGCAAPSPAPATELRSSSPEPAPSPGSTLGGTGDIDRMLLTYDDLMDGFEAVSPVDNAALALPLQAAPPVGAAFDQELLALFPNGTTYYYASDNREFTWDAALREAGEISAMCQ